MKHLLLLFAFFAIALATGRLPLPQSIQQSRPELVNEPITSDFVRIVGGVNVSQGGAPHQVALLRNGTFFCAGSLIGSRSVVTAAHCVYGYESKPSLFQIRYGSLNVNNGTVINVTRIVRHPSYNSNSIDFDVAVMTLGLAFSPGTNAKVISLATTAPAANSSVNVTGWGRLSANGASPTQLQLANTLKVLTKADCQKRWGSTNTITDRMICAHSKTQSSCNGDSGGPLTQRGILVGIVSWGSSSCLHATYPNVYTNVTNLRSWIQSNSY